MEYGVVRPDHILVSDEGEAVVGDYALPKITALDLSRFQSTWTTLPYDATGVRYAPLDRPGEAYKPGYVELYSWARTALEIISDSESGFLARGCLLMACRA